jgi:threonine dehydratase
VQQQTGAVFIPPYNYPPVMAGQGTVALEFMKQVGVGWGLKGGRTGTGGIAKPFVVKP